MRIIYGVFGYGRGHATRALSVLPALAKHHEILVLAGGDAYDALAEAHHVVRLPSMGYAYGTHGRHSLVRTVLKNTPPVIDALFEGSVARELRRVVESFAPNVAVSDAEPWTHQLAIRLGIPRVSFDHFGMLAHCKVEVPLRYRWALARDVSTYLLLMGNPGCVIVSSFFPAEPRHPKVRCVGPLLRRQARDMAPSDAGHLLVYFNQGQHQLSARIEAELQKLNRPVVMYGSGARGRRGRIDFRAASNDGFLHDLASCHAVLSTAGNQLVGECVHFRKPLLVVPENCLEQHVNAAAVRRFGIGRAVSAKRLDAPLMRAFLHDRAQWLTALDALASRHRPDALAELERCLFEVAEAKRLAPARSWRYA